MLWYVIRKYSPSSFSDHTAGHVIKLFHRHRVTISLVYHSIGGVHCTNNGTNKRLWLPVAMHLWTSDWRTRLVHQFSVWEERARAWRYQPAVKDCNCSARAIMSRRTGHFRSSNLPQNTMIPIRGKSLVHKYQFDNGPNKSKFHDNCEKNAFHFDKALILHTDILCFVWFI